MTLQQYLMEYRALTIDLIEETRRNGDIESLLEEREIILEYISNNFPREDIKNVGTSLNLLGLEEDFQNEIKQEKMRIKQQIALLKKVGAANANYGRIENRSMLFNKQF